MLLEGKEAVRCEIPRAMGVMRGPGPRDLSCATGLAACGLEVMPGASGGESVVGSDRWRRFWQLLLRRGIT